MKSVRNGKNISVSVENITIFGIWLFARDKEYFLSFDDYPYFKDQPVKSIYNVELWHGFHLYWPDLDVDLEIDNLENPEKYPLKSSFASGKSKLTVIRPQKYGKVEKKNVTPSIKASKNCKTAAQDNKKLKVTYVPLCKEMPL